MRTKPRFTLNQYNSMANNSSMSRIKLVLYDTLNRRLPRRIGTAVASSRLLRPLRDRFLRPGGKPALTRGNVEFEGLPMEFTAPYRTWLKAKHTGIECRICRIIMSQCGPGSVCFDVGANYGFITLVMGLTVQPQGQVLSFEPMPDVCAIVRTNLAVNHLEGCCQVI